MKRMRGWWRNRRDPRVGEELRFHRDQLVERYMASGMDRRDAYRRAVHEFGNVGALEESVRDVRGRWLDDFARDLRYGARTLRKSRAFATAAAATLALAIGANTAMFSVLYAVLLRPLPYRDAEQLAMLWTEDLTQNLRESRSALADVEQWRNQSRTLEDLATFDAVSKTLTAADGAEQIIGASISRASRMTLWILPPWVLPQDPPRTVSSSE